MPGGGHIFSSAGAAPLLASRVVQHGDLTYPVFLVPPDSICVSSTELLGGKPEVCLRNPDLWLKLNRLDD
jgi:hypothetical protein